MKIKTNRIVTLSKYDFGQHHFNPNGDGIISIRESMSPIDQMLRELYAAGVPLGSKIKISIKTVE